jgi:hypothetical protein
MVELFSSFAFNFYLRRYSPASMFSTTAASTSRSRTGTRRSSREWTECSVTRRPSPASAWRTGTRRALSPWQGGANRAYEGNIKAACFRIRNESVMKCFQVIIKFSMCAATPSKECSKGLPLSTRISALGTLRASRT